MILIDADELKQKLLAEHKRIADNGGTMSTSFKNGMCLGIEISSIAVSTAPTIDAEPVRHGKWIDCDYKKFEHGFVENYTNAGKYCSNCRTGFKKEIIEGYIFCPYCGAKMDGGANIP